MGGRPLSWLGPGIVTAIFGFSVAVSVYHAWTHDAPLLATILGQWSLVALSLAFGVVGYYGLTAVDTRSERDTVGVQTAAGYLLAGVASGGYSLHQHLTPEASIALGVILLQATFVALVGGTAGVVVGLEKVRRERSIADLEATTSELETLQTETRTEKRRFESLFQNAPSAIADVRYDDGEPTVERANAVFEDLLEHTTEDVTGCSRWSPSERRRRKRTSRPTSQRTKSTRER